MGGLSEDPAGGRWSGRGPQGTGPTHREQQGPPALVLRWAMAMVLAVGGSFQSYCSFVWRWAGSSCRGISFSSALTSVLFFFSG